MSTPECPLITVVIPTNNRLPLLCKAIASVQAQTIDDWELFIVDDGSTDGTQKAVRSMNDPRIHLIESLNKGNVAALRNEGALAGKGLYLAFLDSDDVWMPRKLELQLAVLKLEKKRWAYTCYELMDDNETFLPHKTNHFRPISGWVADSILQTKTDICICSVMLEKKLFDEAGGFNTHPHLLHRTDYELILRLAILAEVSAIPEMLLRVREHSLRSTKLLDDGHEKSAYVFDHFLHSSPHPKLARLARQKLAFHMAEISVIKMKRKQYREAATQLWQAFLNGDRWSHLLSAFRRGIV